MANELETTAKENKMVLGRQVKSWAEQMAKMIRAMMRHITQAKGKGKHAGRYPKWFADNFQNQMETGGEEWTAAKVSKKPASASTETLTEQYNYKFNQDMQVQIIL